MCHIQWIPTVCVIFSGYLQFMSTSNAMHTYPIFQHHIQEILTLCVIFSGYLQYMSQSVNTDSVSYMQWIPKG